MVNPNTNNWCTDQENELCKAYLAAASSTTLK